MAIRSSVSRRQILRTAVATSVVVGAGHTISPVSAQRGTENEMPDWDYIDGVDGGVEDLRGQDEVTVDVGAQGNGGGLAFSPAGIWIDPGTTVTWEWTGDGGEHNVETVDGPAELESQLTASAGETYEYEFTEEDQGITDYVCAPHEGLDMKGAVAVGDDVPTVSQNDNGAYLDGVDGGHEDLRGQDEVTVMVGAEGNGGDLAFSPAGIWIDPGTTVTWEWTGNGGDHNVVTEDGPADLESELRSSSGHTYEYEFTEDHKGITDYVCAPHEGLDMKGAVAVGDDIPIADEFTGDSDTEFDGGSNETATDEAAQNESVGDVSVEVPGFGIVSTLAGIASASYMLRHRPQADKEP